MKAPDQYAQGSGKGARFLAERIGSDAITIAELVEQCAAKDTRIAELEAILTTKQRERLQAKPKA